MFFPVYCPQHFLNFLPLPQGQGSFLPALGVVLTTCLGGSTFPVSKYQMPLSFLKVDRS
jgi:hypothetical protein